MTMWTHQTPSEPSGRNVEARLQQRRLADARCCPPVRSGRRTVASGPQTRPSDQIQGRPLTSEPPAPPPPPSPPSPHRLRHKGPLPTVPRHMGRDSGKSPATPYKRVRCKYGRVPPCLPVCRGSNSDDAGRTAGLRDAFINHASKMGKFQSSEV